MPHRDDWIPAGLPEFKIFADTFCSEVATNKTDWELNVTDAAAIVGEHTTFNDDYAISSVKDNHTSLEIKATNDARKPLEARIRKMGIPMKTNTLMTDVNRTTIATRTRCRLLPLLRPRCNMRGREIWVARWFLVLPLAANLLVRMGLR